MDGFNLALQNADFVVAVDIGQGKGQKMQSLFSSAKLGIETLNYSEHPQLLVYRFLHCNLCLVIPKS